MEPIPNFLTITQRRCSAPLIRHGKEFWQKALHEHEISGLSPSQFCLERGLAKATFFKWRKVLKGQLQSALPASHLETQSLPGFLAVPLGSTQTSPTNSQQRQVPMRSDAEHHCNDAKMAINRQVVIWVLVTAIKR